MPTATGYYEEGKVDPLTNINVGGGKFVPTATPATPQGFSGVITSDNVVPVSPYKLPNPTQTNTATDIIQSATTGSANLKKSSDAEIARNTELEKVRTEQSKTKTDLSSVLEEIGLQPQKTIEAETAAGLPEKQKELDEITNQIEAKQLASQRAVQDLEKNFVGSPTGRADAINKIQKDSARELADLSIIQNAKNRNLLTAQNLVNRKVELQTESLKARFDTLKFFYDENKEQLNKADQRAFEAEIKKADREYAEGREKVKTLETLKLNYLNTAVALGKGNAVLQALQSATTPEDVLKIAGQNGVISLEDQVKLKQLDKVNAEIKSLGVPAIINPQASIYAGALSTILGSGTFTKDQKNLLINSINNGEDPFAVIKNQAKNIMGQTLATKLDNYETAKAQVESIDTLLDKYYANGGKTNILSGNYEKVLNSLGQVSDPKLVQIATEISSALQIYRNAVSGTAYSVQEGKDIASIFPGINKTEGLNDAIISGRLGAFETTIDSQYRNTLGKSYDELKKAGQTAKITEQQAITQIASFQQASPENKAVIDNLRKIAPNATPEEILKQIKQK